MKIIITGALGYIGTELCHLYSGEARYKEIIAIDNRFLSARVQQLSDWGITFVHGDIRDKELMTTILQDADIIYHLASITDVAYTKKQETEEKEKAITEIGIGGLQNILDAIPHTCKLLFPSSHTVYDGLTETILDIDENKEPQPGLTYSTMKASSEKIIRTAKNNYIIVRLGSVYGLSGDNMRINIMPNLFSKIAAQNGTISLYAGGIQYKSLIDVHDVVRAMRHLVEGSYTGTYHLAHENTTVKDVADICKKVNPAVTLVTTDDEIPNKGYTLSNRKLLDTGFGFLYNIENSIREMIRAWSAKEQPKDLEYIIRGQKEYVDTRGRISNFELVESINLIGYIESKEGTVRANHYHPIQQQQCLLISGRYISVTKDLSYPDAPVEYRTIHPGDIAVIRSNVAHTMVFLQDSVFLNLVNGEREHKNYGITHTIPYTLVTDILRDAILSMYTKECRSCGCKNLQLAVSLGMSPLANNLLDSKDQQCDMYPLEMEYCSQCHNCQLSIVVPPNKMFDNYLYVSSTSASFRNHFETAATRYIEEFGLTSDSLVVDIGSNDGVFLRPLKDKDIRVCGIEPATNLATLAIDSGINTYNSYFNTSLAQQIVNDLGQADIVTASNVFAHSDTLKEMTNATLSLLKDTGVFIIEVQYLMDTMKDLTFDNIYHEHVNYWTVTSLVNFFTGLGYSLFHVEHIDTHGGSIRCYIDRATEPRGSVRDFLEQEELNGVKAMSTYTLFGKRVHGIRDQVQRNMNLLKERYSTICAYGSPAKATTALNFFGITSEYIDYTLEDNSLKWNKFIPGTDILITSSKGRVLFDDHLCIVFAWNFFDSIRAKLPAWLPCISIKDLQEPWLPILDTPPQSLKGHKVTGKVYDCFMFFNELDTLELRLNILDPIVDYFVICESAYTHSGIHRNYLFAAHMNDERFSKFLYKIRYIQLDLIPNGFINLTKREVNTPIDTAFNKKIEWVNTPGYLNTDNIPHCREWYQRDTLLEGLTDCQPDDIIMMSELDEIPNPVTVQQVLNNFDSSRVYCMRNNSYYYYLNLLKETHWVGTRIACYDLFSTFRISNFKHHRDIIVANGGWHFSFQGGHDKIKEKILAYCHCDMATDSVIDSLPQKIDSYTDPFDRGVPMKRVDIDHTFPQYLRDNIEHLNHMII